MCVNELKDIITYRLKSIFEIISINLKVAQSPLKGFGHRKFLKKKYNNNNKSKLFSLCDKTS